MGCQIAETSAPLLWVRVATLVLTRPVGNVVIPEQVPGTKTCAAQAARFRLHTKCPPPCVSTVPLPGGRVWVAGGRTKRTLEGAQAHSISLGVSGKEASGLVPGRGGAGALFCAVFGPSCRAAEKARLCRWQLAGLKMGPTSVTEKCPAQVGGG